MPVVARSRAMPPCALSSRSDLPNRIRTRPHPPFRRAVRRPTPGRDAGRRAHRSRPGRMPPAARSDISRSARVKPRATRAAPDGCPAKARPSDRPAGPLPLPAAIGSAGVAAARGRGRADSPAVFTGRARRLLPSAVGHCTAIAFAPPVVAGPGRRPPSPSRPGASAVLRWGAALSPARGAPPRAARTGPRSRTPPAPRPRAPAPSGARAAPAGR